MKLVNMILVQVVIFSCAIAYSSEATSPLQLCIDKADANYLACRESALDILSEGANQDTYLVYQAAYNDYNFYCADRRRDAVNACHQKHDHEED